jgi:hypothetical protein
MAGPVHDYERRPCIGRKERHYPIESRVALGGGNEIRMVPEIVNAAMEHPMVFFLSTDPQQSLYDFM